MALADMLALLNRVYTSFSPPRVEKEADALRFGILGAAKIAPLALIVPALSHPGVIVQAVAARDRSRAEAFAKKHGIPEIKDSYEALLSDPLIDAVFIPLPNSLHYEWSLRAVRAGKHVLVEKPCTSTAAEAALLFREQPEGVVVLEAFHNRFHPSVLMFMSLVSPPDVVDVYTDNMVPSWFTKKSDLEYSHKLGGGSIMALGTYGFALLRMAFGGRAPEECVSCETESFEGDPVADPRCDYSFRAVFRFADGGIGEARSTLQGNPIVWKPSECRVLHRPVVVDGVDLPEDQEMIRRRKVTLHGCMHAVLWHRIDVEDSLVVRYKEGRGTDGGMAVKEWTEKKSYKAYTHREAAGEQSGFAGEDWWMSYRYQLEAFVDKIKGRKTPYWIDGEDSVEQMKMIDMAYAKSKVGPRPTSEFR